MKLDKARELLQAIVLTGQYDGDPDDSDAIKLGIEALKLIQRNYEYLSVMGDVPLPGEDPE